MKKHLLFIWLPLIFTFSCNKKQKSSQQKNSEENALVVNKYFGILGSDGNSAVLTKDNNVVFTCRHNFGIVTVFKITPSKTIIWKREYNYSEVGPMIAVIEGSQGDLFFCGFHTLNSVDGIFVVKTDSKGDIIWRKLCGGGEVKRMIRTSDGNILLAGICNLDSQLSKNDVFLTKINPNGDVLWRKEYVYMNDNLVSDLIQTKDGGYVVTCSYNRDWSSYEKASYGYILKTDQTGVVVWHRPTSYPVTRAADCSLELSNSDLLFGSHSNFPYLVKTDSSGIFKLSKEFYVTDEYQVGNRIFTMKKDQLGNISLAGWQLLTSKSLSNVLYMKVNEDLEQLAKNTLLKTPGSCATNLVNLPNGKCMLIGPVGGDSIFVSVQ